MLLSCRKVIVCFIFSSKWNKNFFNLAFGWNFDNCIRSFFSINSNRFANLTSLWINIVGRRCGYIAIFSVNHLNRSSSVSTFIFFITDDTCRKDFAVNLAFGWNFDNCIRGFFSINSNLFANLTSLWINIVGSCRGYIAIFSVNHLNRSSSVSTFIFFITDDTCRKDFAVNLAFGWNFDNCIRGFFSINSNLFANLTSLWINIVGRRCGYIAIFSVNHLNRSSSVSTFIFFITDSTCRKDFAVNLAFGWNFDNCIRSFFSINSNRFANLTSLWINIVGSCRGYIAIFSVNCNRIFITVSSFIFFKTDSTCRKDFAVNLAFGWNFDNCIRGFFSINSNLFANLTSLWINIVGSCRGYIAIFSVNHLNSSSSVSSLIFFITDDTCRQNFTLNLAFGWNFDNCIRGFFSINSNLFANLTSLWIDIVGRRRGYIAILSVNCNRIFITVSSFIFFKTDICTFFGDAFFYLIFSWNFYNSRCRLS